MPYCFCHYYCAYMESHVPLDKDSIANNTFLDKTHPQAGAYRFLWVKWARATTEVFVNKSASLFCDLDIIDSDHYL